MLKEVKLPDLGEGVKSATVAAILVSAGDSVKTDQPIIELETEKAVAEIPAPEAGKVAEIKVAEGDEISVGQVIFTLEAESSDDNAQPEQPQTQAAKQETQPEVNKPESQHEPQPEPPVQEPDQQETVPPVKKERPASQKTEPKEPAATGDDGKLFPVVPDAKPTGQSDIPAAPAVRRLADELGVDLASIKTDSADGWLTEADVLQAAKSASSDNVEKKASSATKSPAKTAETNKLTESNGEDQFGPVRTESLSKIRQTIARRMRLSRDNTVALTNFDDADVTELEKFRSDSSESFKAEGVSVSLLPFVIKAAVETLKKHPVINSSLDLENSQITYKHYINIGIAVDTDRGLVVPVLQNTDRLSIMDIARKIADLGSQCRSGDFDMSIMAGGTFTISNLGSVGGRYSTPIINYPQSAILLVGRSKLRPACHKGEIVPRMILPLSLSYDHQIIDGAAAGRFLTELISYLENPARLLTH